MWPGFADPYYDSHWLYTVPYTVYTTGIAWRKDLVDVDPYALVDGWGFPWVARQSGKTAILDDYREAITLALLYNGVTDVNTTDPLIIDTARQSLLDLNSRVGLRIDNDTSRQLATGRSWIHHAWSGQVVAAARRLPRGVPVEALGYWFPPDGKGPVANDTGTVLRGAQNPVLAHLFLNFLLNRANAMHNIAGTGYMQPLTYATPKRLVSGGHHASQPDLRGRPADVPGSRAQGTRDPAHSGPALAAGVAGRRARTSLTAFNVFYRLIRLAPCDLPVISKTLPPRSIRSNQE